MSRARILLAVVACACAGGCQGGAGGPKPAAAPPIKQGISRLYYIDQPWEAVRSMPKCPGCINSYLHDFTQRIRFELRDTSNEPVRDQWTAQVLVTCWVSSGFRDVFYDSLEAGKPPMGRVCGRHYPGFRRVMLFNHTSDHNGVLTLRMSSTREGLQAEYTSSEQIKGVYVFVRVDPGDGKYQYAGGQWGTGAGWLSVQNVQGSVGYQDWPAEQVASMFPGLALQAGPQPQWLALPWLPGLECVEWQDADGDLLVDSLDGCPTDWWKSEPGICGCGQSDNDSDGDGLADCFDPCPHNLFATRAPCTPYADSDSDTDVDSDDFGDWQRCQGSSADSACLRWAGVTFDQFKQCASRAGVPGPCMQNP